MEAVKLPSLPKGRLFEEYVSSLLLLGRYHVERNLILRDIEDVLELDIVLTNYETVIPELKIVETKSGNWGLADLFKMYGWMCYLHIDSGVFIAKKERANLDFYKSVAAKMKIDLFVISNLYDIKQTLTSMLPGITSSLIDEEDVSHWRFSFWVERCLLDHLYDQRKIQSSMKCFNSLCSYNHEINGGIFFTENIIEKVHKLYTTFMNFPHITVRTGHEIIGNSFEEEYSELPRPLYQDTFFSCKYNDLHVSMYLEHRARLAILKSAVDYLLFKACGDGKRTKDIKKTILGLEFSLIDTLPNSFKDGLTHLSKHKNFNKYPVFWQWFMWVFGGFILKDYEENEYQMLSRKTGVPLEEVQNAFDSYQILFPVKDGWFTEYPDSNIRHLKMFPVPFMGIGANYRRYLYRKKEEPKPEMAQLDVTGKWTVSDLIKWNNLVYEVIKP